MANLLVPLEKHMLVGGVIEKWNVLVDFESKKVPLNVEAITKFITKVLHAYPLRLKRVLFVNIGNGGNAPIIAQITELIKKFDQDVQV